MHPRLLIACSLVAMAACSSTRASTESGSRVAPLIEYSAPRGGFLSATVFGTKPILSVAATFWAPENAGAGVVCTAREVASCSVRVCEAHEGAARSLTAGAIRIGADQGKPIALEPDALGHYANPAGKARPWLPGARIHLESSGADVEPFGVDLTAPPALEVFEPNAALPLTIDRAAGYEAHWASDGAGGATGATGTVRVAIRQDRDAAKTALEAGVSVDCFFPRSDGQGMVPVEALRDLAPGAPTNAMVYSVEQTHVRAAGFDTVVLVNTGGIFKEATIR
jgi:hypothetical protein